MLLQAQQPAQRYNYAKRDTGYLQLDLYRPDLPRRGHPTIIYFHGGGFFEGSYNSPDAVRYCRLMQQQATPSSLSITVCA